MGNKLTYTSDRAQYRVLLILATLADGPISAAEIAERLPCSKTTACEYLSHIGARVADWARSEGTLVPLYDDTTGPDAPRPPALTRKERNSRMWARIRGDELLHARRNARKRKPNRPDKAAAWITRDTI